MVRRDKEIVHQMKEIRELLSEFGVALSGYDPGVSGYFIDPSKPKRGDGYWGEPFTINGATWQWLKPLLDELLNARQRLMTQPIEEEPRA